MIASVPHRQPEGVWGDVGDNGGEEGVGSRTIVEAARVPHPVVAPGAAMEVHAVGTVKHVDAVVRVLAGMTVYNVDEHNQAQPMGLIH